MSDAVSTAIFVFDGSQVHELGHSLSGRGHCIWVQAIANAGSTYRALDKACRLEFFKVLGNCALSQWQLIYDIIALALFFLAQ